MLKCSRGMCGVAIPEGDAYWNSSTRQWYCEQCAIGINEANPNLCVHEQSLPHDFEDKFTAAAKVAGKAGWLVMDEPLDKTLERVAAWLHDLHRGMTINCVYCGHSYGPKKDTPAVMADVLKAHIAKCPAHPLSKALRALRIAETALDDASSVVDPGDDEKRAYERELEVIRGCIKECEGAG